MTDPGLLGRFGEAAAAEYLRGKGYRILGQNYRTRRGEMDRGLLRRDDPEMLAFAYTVPISSLIHLCDREPERTEEALAKIEAFSRHFIRTYGEKTPVTIRKLTAREIPAALALAWRVFSEYESPDYAPEGTDTAHPLIRHWENAFGAD